MKSTTAKISVKGVLGRHGFHLFVNMATAMIKN